MTARHAIPTALLVAALSLVVSACDSATPTPTIVQPSPTSTLATLVATFVPTASPVPTKPAAATAVPTAVAKPAGTPAPAVATPKTGRPALPAAAIIATAQWGFDSAYVYTLVPTDQSHSATAGKIMDKTVIQVLDAQVGWNAYPNETDGNVWYKVGYKDTTGKDLTGYVHASAVKFTP